MKLFKPALLSVVVVLCAMASTTVLAHGRARVGVFIGAPLFVPYYYPPHNYYYPPYYYPPYYPPVVVPQSPPVYIEQGQAPAAAPAQRSDNYWYYCAESNAYYPYVKQCAGEWRRVAPQPPS
jgi:hypothetical protein